MTEILVVYFATKMARKSTVVKEVKEMSHEKFDCSKFIRECKTYENRLRSGQFAVRTEADRVVIYQPLDNRTLNSSRYVVEQVSHSKVRIRREDTVEMSPCVQNCRRY